MYDIILTIYLLVGFSYALSMVICNCQDFKNRDDEDLLLFFMVVLTSFIFWPVFIIWEIKEITKK